MITTRASNYRDYNDLLSNLLAANDNDSEGVKLTDEELVGNIFVFLIGKSLSPDPVLIAQVHPYSRPRNHRTHVGIQHRDAGSLSRNTGETLQTRSGDSCGSFWSASASIFPPPPRPART